MPGVGESEIAITEIGATATCRELVPRMTAILGCPYCREDRDEFDGEVAHRMIKMNLADRRRTCSENRSCRWQPGSNTRPFQFDSEQYEFHPGTFIILRIMNSLGPIIVILMAVLGWASASCTVAGVYSPDTFILHYECVSYVLVICSVCAPYPNPRFIGIVVGIVLGVLVLAIIGCCCCCSCCILHKRMAKRDEMTVSLLSAPSGVSYQNA